MTDQNTLLPEPEPEKKKKNKKDKKDKELKEQQDQTKTFLAFERTLLAWVRTATNLLTFGFGIIKLLEDKAREPGQHPLLEIIRPVSVGYLMIGAGFLGLFMSVLAYRRHAILFGKTPRQIYLNQAMLVSYVILGLSLLILVAPLLRELLVEGN